MESTLLTGVTKAPAEVQSEKFTVPLFAEGVGDFCCKEIKSLAQAEEKKATAVKKRKYETDNLAKYQSRKEKLTTESVDNLCADGRSYEKDKTALRAIDASISATGESIGLIDGTLLPRIGKEIQAARASLAARIEGYCKEGLSKVTPQIETLHQEAKELLSHAWLIGAAFRKVCTEFFPTYGVTAFNFSISLPEFGKDEQADKPATKTVIQIITKDGKSYFCQTSTEKQIFKDNNPDRVAESHHIELAAGTADQHLNNPENKKQFIKRSE